MPSHTPRICADIVQPFGQSSERATGDNTMFTKAILGLAVILVTASGALAATRTHNIPSQNTYIADCVHVAFPQCSGGQ
jgi:hypothetical protein